MTSTAIPPGKPDPASPPARPAIVLMGVSGSGKTTVGEKLAPRLGLSFRDADEFHPPANVAKMAAGIPLDDADRWPWLDAIGVAIRAARNDGIVVTCSALKRVYRARIRAAAGGPVRFVHLAVSHPTLARRLAARRGHFFPPSLLDSQLATLEPPAADENAITLSAEGSVDEVTEAVMAALHAPASSP